MRKFKAVIMSTGPDSNGTAYTPEALRQAAEKLKGQGLANGFDGPEVGECVDAVAIEGLVVATFAFDNPDRAIDPKVDWVGYIADIARQECSTCHTRYSDPEQMCKHAVDQSAPQICHEVTGVIPVLHSDCEKADPKAGIVEMEAVA